MPKAGIQFQKKDRLTQEKDSGILGVWDIRPEKIII